MNTQYREKKRWESARKRESERPKDQAMAPMKSISPSCTKKRKALPSTALLMVRNRNSDKIKMPSDLKISSPRTSKDHVTSSVCVCVCVCVREREREREREKEEEREREKEREKERSREGGKERERAGER